MSAAVQGAVMPDTGWKFPGTMVGNRTVAGSDADWTNQDDCKADDGNTADLVLTGAGDISSGLAASNFDFSDVPTGATIDGIEVRIGDYIVDTVGGTPTINAVNLILADGSDGTENKSAEIAAAITSLQTDDAGGALDLWGEALATADVTDVDFGFFVSMGLTSAVTTDFDVDFLQMRVFYHEGLPTRIGFESFLAGNNPPHKSSAGAFYAVQNTNQSLDVFKTTDPTTDSWTVQDDTNNPTAAVDYSRIASFQVGDVIHIASCQDDPNQYKYHTFDMADDTWGTTSEAIQTVSTNQWNWISIVVRANGDVVVAYTGEIERNMGDDKERVDLNIRNGSWGGPIQLDASGDIHYGNPELILGTNDGVHCRYQFTTMTSDPPFIWHNSGGRTLRVADDSLSSQSSVLFSFGGLEFSEANSMKGGVSFDDGGTQRIDFFGSVNTGSETWIMAVHLGTEDGSDDLVVAAENAVQLDPLIETVSRNSSHSVVELHGVFHAIYAHKTANDIYCTRSDDEGVTWDTPVLEVSSNTTLTSANVYVRGADIVMGYVYDDGGEQRYNEKVLSTMLDAFTPKEQRTVRSLLR